MTRTIANPTSARVASPRPVRRGRVATHLLWSYLLSSTIPVIVVGAILLIGNFQTQQQAIYEQQRLLAVQAAGDINDYFHAMHDSLHTLGEQWDGMDSEKHGSEGLRILSEFAPNLRRFSIVRQDGHQEALFTAIPNTRAEFTGLPDLASDADIQAGLAGTYRLAAMSRAANRQLTFVLIVPVNPHTVIRAEIDALPVVRLLRTSARFSQGTLFLINNNGDVVQGSDETGLVVERSDFLETLPTQDPREYKDSLGNAVLGMRYSLPAPAAGWSIVLERPIERVFAGTWDNLRLFVLLVGVVGLISAIWAVVQARRFIVPLRALRDGAAEFGAGHFNHRIFLRRNSANELADVGHTFNRMADQLQQSLAAIEQKNEYFRRGLILARDIQMGLLPKEPPWPNNMIEIESVAMPAFEVGGDFYSYLTLADGKPTIAIGDISGKGVGAALMTALTISALESCAREYDSPSEVLSALNRQIASRLRANKMQASLMLVSFDDTNNVLYIANAGMIAPFIIRRKGAPPSSNSAFIASYACAMAEVGGLPLGSLLDIPYQEIKVQLIPGDKVLMVTDGIVEAQDKQGDMFGFERFESYVVSGITLIENRVRTDKTLLEYILTYVNEFVGSAPQHDDMTMLLLDPQMTVPEPVPYQNGTTPHHVLDTSDLIKAEPRPAEVHIEARERV